MRLATPSPHENGEVVVRGNGLFNSDLASLPSPASAAPATFLPAFLDGGGEGTAAEVDAVFVAVGGEFVAAADPAG